MEKFKSNYSSDINMIISNAHYVIDEIDKEEKTKNKKTVLLHLSNLSIEKGLSRYIEVVKFLCEKGEYEFILAGPFNSKEDEEYFKNTNESVKKKINYLGPIYGKEKNEILSKTDILLFPSKYKNEAEPNVIYEAQSFGAFTIAYDYASIKEQLSEASGMLIPIDRNYAQEAVITINKINNNEITIDSDKIKNELKHKATINKAEYQKLIEIFK
jgi:glycosyltransferase involved in cell wall biosynthesis